MFRTPPKLKLHSRAESATNSIFEAEETKPQKDEARRLKEGKGKETVDDISYKIDFLEEQVSKLSIDYKKIKHEKDLLQEELKIERMLKKIMINDKRNSEEMRSLKEILICIVRASLYESEFRLHLKDGLDIIRQRIQYMVKEEIGSIEGIAPLLEQCTNHIQINKDFTD